MISVIVYGRNDSHGYNLPKRAALSFNCIARVLTHPDDEIVFVDCNTPEDLPTFPESIADTLTPRAKELLRILRLRPEQYEKGKNGTKFKVLEPLCRNVAIRRTNPANRWILNTNTDMVFVPLPEGKSLSDVASGLADGFYELPRFEMPEILWESADRLDPRATIESFKHWGRRLHLNERVANMPEILFDGPGDFQLALRKQMFAIHGMNEQMVLGWHVDSNLCKRLFLLNGQTRSLLDQAYAYHCDHTRLNTVYHSLGESTQNDWRKFCSEVTSPAIPQQALTWGLPGETIEEIRLTAERAARYARTLEKLLPGLTVPMLESALTGGSYNHGLLYDNHHVLPYLADHLTTLPPRADVGYLGGNVELVRMLAGFREEFGHTGRILFDRELMVSGLGPGWEALPRRCVPVEAPQLYREAFVYCFDLSMKTFPAVQNEEGFALPKPSEEAGRHAALLLRRLIEFGRLEKQKLDAGSSLPRKFLFLGTQNTWFEDAVAQVVSVVLTPYSSYVRHGVVRKDAFTKPFLPVPGHQMLIQPGHAGRAAWVEQQVGHPVSFFDFTAVEVRADLLAQGALAEQPGEAVRAGLMSSEAGRAVVRLHALMAETDGQLEAAEGLRQILAAFERKPAPDRPSQDAPAKLSAPAPAPAGDCPVSSERRLQPAATCPPAPAPAGDCRPGRKNPVIGIDVRTLFYPDSAARGIGHYTCHHLQSLAACRPDWRFVLYANAMAAPKVLEPLLALPNVQLKLFAGCRAGDIDLFHIPDPLCLKPDYVSPMDLMPEVPASVMFYDLAGLRIYLPAYTRLQRFQYVERLEQLLKPRFRLLTCSEFTRRDLIEATGLAPERAVAILAGLNRSEDSGHLSSAFVKQVRAKHGINRRFLLHVGALDPHKNFESVLNVLGQLKADDLQLVVVGEKGYFLKQIAESVARAGVTQIIFTGFIPRAELEALYREAVALVSLSLYEGFGFPVLEAMAQGCPVVASDITSLPEVTGDAALLYPPRDIRAVSRGIRELLNSPALRRKLVERGRARAAQFSWEKTARKTIAVWEEMLAVAQPGAIPVAATPRQAALVWLAPWQNPSGYCSEALAFAGGLAQGRPLAAVDVARTRSPEFVKGLPPASQDWLRTRLSERPELAGQIVVEHIPATGFSRLPGAGWCVGRTMFETDRLPADWVAKCNQLDEIWVPSRFNLQTFAASGVERAKLQWLPGAVDETLFNPALHEPLPLPHQAACIFLSVFEWSIRKGWDVLLAAYLREFSAADDVCLCLRTYLVDRPDADPRTVLDAVIRQFAQSLNLGDKPWPRVEILAGQIPTREMPRLYRSANCLVAPSRGEGWGRPHHEAMMMGVPVIATNWSGNTEFMTSENSYLLDFELVEAGGLEPGLAHYRGHRWAMASETHLRKLMRHVQQHPEEARQRGAKAREHVLRHFSLQPVAARLQERLEAIDRRLAGPAAKPVAMAWEGTFLDFGSLSHVNRQLTRQLARRPGVALTRVGNPVLDNGCAAAPELRALAGELASRAPTNTQVTVRHAWPPNWAPVSRGALVVIQPWEYGSLPADWVKQAAHVQQLWVYSEYVRQVYVRSGVPAAKVKVVPLGVDPERFRPEAPALPLTTGKTFKFLFVGGTIHRKGPDILLAAYLNSFTAQDDVCLVIKDLGRKSFYAGQTLERSIQAAQSRPGAPEILCLDDELPPDSLPSLYTACDCLVHPYRGEGFGLPVIEAMACGLPVIVTEGGATDDFAPANLVYRLAAERRAIGRQISGMTLAGEGWLLEPSVADTAAWMRHVFGHRDEARAKGRASSEHVRRNWTWQCAAAVAQEQLQSLVSQPAMAVAGPEPGPVRKPTPIALPPCALVGQLGPARELLRRRKLPEAWTATRAAIQVRPFHPEAWLLLAEIASAAGAPDRARQCGQRARQLAPEWKPAKKFLQGPLRGNAKPAWLVLPEPITNPPLRLSVCLIAKNEEQFLPQCLASVRGLAGQVVVLDTGSTDRTAELAREAGAEVYHFPWRDDFSAARNAALEHVTGDWVLVLDADEELPPDSHEPLRRLMQDKSALGWRLPIVDAGREDEGCSYVPRLFRNAPALFYVGRVHEQIFSSLEVRRRQWGLDNRLGNAPLRHHGYRPEVVKDRDKIQRNLRLLERAVVEMPDEPSLLMSYGLELARSGERERGVIEYFKALGLMSAQPASAVVPELRETLLTQLCTQLMALKRWDDMVRLLNSPLAQAGGLTASLHFALGLAHLEQKQFCEAADQMRQCLAKRHQPALAPINKEIHQAGPRHCLALCLDQLRQPEAAAQEFRRALQDDPQSRPARLDYAGFQAAHGQPVQALNLYHALANEKPGDAQPWLRGGRLALSAPEFREVALDWTSEAQRHLPEDPAVARQRAQALTLAGQCEAALPLWRRIAGSADPPEQAQALAAVVLCETASGQSVSAPPAALETRVSREFLTWYQRLVRFNARAALEALNARLEPLQSAIPSAARLLAAALAQAQPAPAP
jgi:glycosyltransferase involved in cell wall biosynthesis/tetratricopeptide (TPR) repeat protein